MQHMHGLNAWGLHFGVGPTTSAVVVFGRNRAGVHRFRFHVGEHVLPRVSAYTYLGSLSMSAWFGRTISASFLCRGERKLAACASWTSSTSLQLHFVERIFQSYVRPSACLGLEFVPQGPHIRRFQSRLCTWGRRLLAWPNGSPRIAVQGQLGWHDADTLRLSQAASLSLPAHCFAAQFAEYALRSLSRGSTPL